MRMWGAQAALRASTTRRAITREVLEVPANLSGEHFIEEGVERLRREVFVLQLVPTESVDLVSREP